MTKRNKRRFARSAFGLPRSALIKVGHDMVQKHGLKSGLRLGRTPCRMYIPRYVTENHEWK